MSVTGGLIVFGAVGFVVGPLIIALMLTFGEIVAARAKGPRAPDPPPPASVL